MTYIQPKPIPIRERASILFLEHGRIDVDDGAFVLIDRENGHTHIPVGGLACLMLEPGTRISHAAVALAARINCLLVWTGEAGVRLYSAGQPGGASARHLLYQARIALDETARLNVVREMYRLRFGDKAPDRRSIDQVGRIAGETLWRLERCENADAEHTATILDEGSLAALKRQAVDDAAASVRDLAKEEAA